MPVLDVQALRLSHRRFIAQHEAGVTTELRRAAEEGVAYVQRNPGFKPRTGGLQRATEGKVVRLRSGGVVRLANRKPYAAAIDKGAGPHVIFYRRKKFLRFVIGGSVYYRRAVNHPGNRAYGFLRRATEHSGQTFLTRMSSRMTTIARSF